MGRIVAIVGRPNVGKSTLFNRLTKTRHAIVEESSGVTRDRHYGQSDWNGVPFSVIDTGGYVVGSDDIFEGEIRKQVVLALEEADVILFMVNVEDGVSPLDESVADLLRRTDKPIVLVANKVDNNARIPATQEFYELGFGDLFGISAMNGAGTGDLLDKVVELFDDEDEIDFLPDLPRIAIVGRPNVGKSSLINALTGDERNIVTPISGTTRDTILNRFKGFGFDFYLVDTAGIRKRARVKENIEFYSVMRSVRAIENCDIGVLMIDASLGFEAQDLAIFSLLERNKKGVVILINKWDLVEKDHKTIKEFEEKIKSKIAPFTDVPIFFVSVKDKQRIIKAFEEVVRVYERSTKRITTSVLNEFIMPILERQAPPVVKGKMVKVKYVTQLPTKFVAFAFFCNLPQYVKDPYKRFIENQLRKEYDFSGIPIEIYFRQK